MRVRSSGSGSDAESKTPQTTRACYRVNYEMHSVLLGIRSRSWRESDRFRTVLDVMQAAVIALDAALLLVNSAATRLLELLQSQSGVSSSSLSAYRRCMSWLKWRCESAASLYEIEPPGEFHGRSSLASRHTNSRTAWSSSSTMSQSLSILRPCAETLWLTSS